ncbi:MAG: hypothetical protein EAZ30_11410 [Betaproteobacteria bacterium]|nr:MAG: hypothetical protein EAZ30_11410 [Betaproteobacteria bacterium]
MRNQSAISTVARSNSAVTATAVLSPQNLKNAAPANHSKKTYRQSSVSTTIRVPNSLLREVKALISASRGGKRNDPDSWD